MVVIRDLRPDRFFDEAQQRRLAELMSRWRAARDCCGEALTAEEQAELDALVEAELRANAERASATC